MVIGIIAVLLAVAAYQITRSRERVSLERALLDLQGRIVRAQSLAAVAGSRLGVMRDPVSPRLAYDASCTNDPLLQLWVRFNGGGTVEIPSRLEYNAGTDQVTVFCETFDLGVETQTTGVFNAPPPATVFAFAPSGRTVTPAGPVAPIYVQVGNPADSQTYGFRILPSGIVCAASVAGGALCDEDLGP